jgi:hypothetical protein
MAFIRNQIQAAFNGDIGRRRIRTGRRTDSQRAYMTAAGRIPPAIVDDCAALGLTLRRNITGAGFWGEFCEFLRSIEDPLRTQLLTMPGSDVSIDIVKGFEPAMYPRHVRQGLSRAFANVDASRTKGIHIYLHGSMADHGYAELSDVDDLIVVDASAWSSDRNMDRVAASMSRAAVEFQCVDPLQHHGHFVVTEFDLMYYDQGILPPVVLNGAIRVLGDHRLRFRVSADRATIEGNARKTISAIRVRIGRAESQRSLDIYELKCLIGEIALMPAYILQSAGAMVTKADAIGFAPNIYSPEAYMALAWATAIRSRLASFGSVGILRSVVRCARPLARSRKQMEALVRRLVPALYDGHPLGITPAVTRSVRLFAKESEELLQGGAGT